MAKKVYGALSLASLTMGMGIYLFFRNLDMVLFQWIPKPPFLEGFFIPVRPSAFSSVLLYNVPDALWFLSGLLFLRCAWFYKARWQRVYIACFCGIALVLELSQASEAVPGTFDVLDLLFMAITAFAEGLLYKIYVKRRLR